MENYRVRVIMFSSSPPIVEYSMSLGMDVVPSYLWDSYNCLRSRTNFAGMPLLREMYKSARSLYRSKYYGYTNSDILISGSLLVILEELLLYHSRGMLTDGVGVIEWVESSSSYRVSCLTLKFLEVFHLNRWNRTLTTSIGLNTSSSHVPFTARLGSVVNLTTRTFGFSTANSISRWLVMWWLVVVGWTTIWCHWLIPRRGRLWTWHLLVCYVCTYMTVSDWIAPGIWYECRSQSSNWRFDGFVL